MFTKPASEIEFSDIEEFCSEVGEGVRVEYKQKIEHIPKIVSSFANTLGGIFIIGAKTDKKTNKVIAIDGIPNSGGLEEQIQQSALTGIYPAVIPQVIIIDIPNNPNNVVVVIRVDESLQAPHAIQNSTRIYIRTGSISQPYELAEIDRIQYMLKRRDDSQNITRGILKRIEQRSESSLYLGPPASNAMSPCLDKDSPNLTVVACPVFSYRSIISTGDIYGFAEKIHQHEYYQSNSISRVAGGVCLQTLARIDGASFTFRELNEYGIIYQRFVLRKAPHAWNAEDEQYLVPDQIVRKIGELVCIARSFYGISQYSGNIEITVQLGGVFGEKLMYNRDQHPERIETQRSSDAEITVSTQCLPLDLANPERLVNVVDELAGQLLWAFNIGDSARRTRIGEILRQCGLVPSHGQ